MTPGPCISDPVRRAGVILTLVHPDYAASEIWQHVARCIGQSFDISVGANIKAASPC